jgi:hypothetical protein
MSGGRLIFRMVSSLVDKVSVTAFPLESGLIRRLGYLYRVSPDNSPLSRLDTPNHGNVLRLVAISLFLLLRLTRPDVIRQLPYQLQLVDHVIPLDRISAAMAGKATLWTHAHPL